MRWATESKQSTHYGDLSLGVHERINDLYARSRRLAPAVHYSAVDSGCTDTRPESGPRKMKAWDMLWEAHCWNAVSDQPETLAACEQAERDGKPYEIFHGHDTSGRFIMSMQFLPEEAPAGAPAAAGRTAVTHIARNVKAGMHMAGVGMIERVRSTGGNAHFYGPLGHRAFALDTLVEVSDPTADDIVTAVTLARNAADALYVMRHVRKRALLIKVADLLYVEPDGHLPDWLRREIVKAARA